MECFLYGSVHIKINTFHYINKTKPRHILMASCTVCQYVGGTQPARGTSKQLSEDWTMHVNP